MREEGKSNLYSGFPVLTSSTIRKSIRQFSGTKWNLPRSTFSRRCTVTMALDWQFSRATTAAAAAAAAVRCNGQCATTDENNWNGVCSDSVAWLLLLLMMLRPFRMRQKEIIYRLLRSFAIQISLSHTHTQSHETKFLTKLNFNDLCSLLGRFSSSQNVH